MTHHLRIQSECFFQSRIITLLRNFIWDWLLDCTMSQGLIFVGHTKSQIPVLSTFQFYNFILPSIWVVSRLVLPVWTDIEMSVNVDLDDDDDTFVIIIAQTYFALLIIQQLVNADYWTWNNRLVPFLPNRESNPRSNNLKGKVMTTELPSATLFKCLV